MSGPLVGRGPRLAAVRLACADVHRAKAFYAAAFGFRDAGRFVSAVPREAAPAPGGARLRLGGQRIELVRAARPGLDSASSTSTAFQHFAIVVADMDAALRRLHRTRGWRAISRDGSETLPASSGGVTAFKFRDPDGHPLELLRFSDGGAPDVWRAAVRRAARSPGLGPCLGIDHTAIGVADTGTSVRWYARLGFTVTGRGVNAGIEQERLDDVDGVRVEVTGLAPPGGAPPHLELLCYREPGAVRERVPDGDRRATRTVLTGPSRSSGSSRSAPARGGEWRDPDGHRVVCGIRQ